MGVQDLRRKRRGEQEGKVLKIFTSDTDVGPGVAIGVVVKS